MSTGIASSAVSAAGLTTKTCIANIDGILVQCPNGKIDVMNLIRRNRGAVNAATGAYISNTSGNGVNGIVSAASQGAEGCGNAFAVLRNNHQRYLIYKAERGSDNHRYAYRTRIVAAIGPDGKTQVTDYRNGLCVDAPAKKKKPSNNNNTSAAILDPSTVADNNGNIQPIQFHLCGLTDSAHWKTRRVLNVDSGKEEEIIRNSDDDSEDFEDDEDLFLEGIDAKKNDKKDSRKKRGASSSTAAAPISSLIADIAARAPAAAAAAPPARSRRGAAQQHSILPSDAANGNNNNNNNNNKRRYTRKQDAPKRVSPYHVFLRLFMSTNAGQGPSFKDAAETWRSLPREQQLQYVATPSQFAAVESQNYELAQNKDGILTQEEHLTQQQQEDEGALLSQKAIAVGEIKPVDTILTAASPAHSTITKKRGQGAVAAAASGGKRSRSSATATTAGVTVVTSTQETLDAAYQSQLSQQSALQPTPLVSQEVEGVAEKKSKKSRSESDGGKKEKKSPR